MEATLDLHTFLATLALVLCTAAVTTILFQRLKQPVILGYLLAGLLVGPHLMLVPAIANREATEILAELGVILLLFALGLEFSLRKLMRTGGPSFVTGAIAISLIFWLGHSAATMLGWNATEALFTGAAIAVSSTTIIAKAFEEQKIRGKVRNLVFGVLIVEDLVSILMLAGLTTIAAGQATSAGELAGTAFQLIGTLILVTVIGLFTIPRAIRWVIGLGSNETTLVTAVGLCFAGAYGAEYLGYSVALGAFLAGSLISESGEGHRVELLVIPVRDVFAAIFFVSVGMLIDPGLVAEHWLAVLVLTLLVVVGKVFAVSLGAFLSGAGTRIAAQTGMSMAQIGEFSFIIAAVGATSPQVRDFLYPVMVAVSAVTTLVTPWLIAASPRASSWVDRKLPKPLQTYASLYATWVEELGRAGRNPTVGERRRRMIRWLLIDAATVVAITIGASLSWNDVRAWLVRELLWSDRLAFAAVWTGVFVVAAPFIFGIFRMARGLADLLARSALPAAERMDRAVAPRRALIVTLEIGIVLVVGLPLVALTQPFLPPFRGAAVLVAILLLLAVAAWRSATNLEGHVHAGAQVLLSAIRDSLPPEHMTTEMPTTGLTGLYPIDGGAADRLTTATHLLPGMGAPSPFRMEAHFASAGKTLAEVGLRGRTGATVLAISRGGVGIPAPSKIETLEPGDTLVLVGTKQALREAKRILIEG
jgi:CPA2 family monovalent cation:H+ antiporter-2